MNEVKINKNEIESIWEKDHLCFVKMKSGKVWLCEETVTIRNQELQPDFETKYLVIDLGTTQTKTILYIEQTPTQFITLPLSKRSENYGK